MEKCESLREGSVLTQRYNIYSTASSISEGNGKNSVFMFVKEQLCFIKERKKPLVLTK